MKILRVLIIFIFIFIGITTSYAQDNSYNLFIDAFEKSEANFKFYNIKSNAIITSDLSGNKLEEVCIELSNRLNSYFGESEIKKEYNTTDGLSLEIRSKNYTIKGKIKNKNESYIMVDILRNKVYKDIVGICAIIEENAEVYSINFDTNVCIVGEYRKKLQKSKYDDIFDEILYNMNAKEIDRVEEGNTFSRTAYSKEINENYLEYMGKKLNLNIGIRYSEKEEKTFLYMATPIIKLDY